MIGFRDYFKKNAGYLETQVGNPDGADKPNKKYYDPRKSLSSLPPLMTSFSEFCHLRRSGHCTDSKQPLIHAFNSLNIFRRLVQKRRGNNEGSRSRGFEGPPYREPTLELQSLSGACLDPEKSDTQQAIQSLHLCANLHFVSGICMHRIACRYGCLKNAPQEIYLGRYSMHC